MSILSDLPVNRPEGKARFFIVADRSNDLQRVVSKSGLIGDASNLVEFTREEIKSILTDLLWRHKSYSLDVKLFDEAKYIAEITLLEHESKGCRYFSNRESVKSITWTPFTDSPFDSGIILLNQNGEHLCVWMEDEL
jgi:hypothetical protein